MAIWRFANTPIMEVPKPTDEHGWLMGDYDNMVPHSFYGDCLPKLLIDADDVPNSKESDDDDKDDDFNTNESNDLHDEN